TRGRPDFLRPRPAGLTGSARPAAGLRPAADSHIPPSHQVPPSPRRPAPPALPVERRARGPGPRSPPAPLPTWTPILTAIPRCADNPGRRRPEAALAPDSRQDLLGVTLDGDEGLGATAGLDGDTFE